MSIPLTINGAVFEYPVDFDENWGVDATGWAQAVTNGMLQMAGGNFPLTADVNFGTNFGLKAKYLISTASNPASAGYLRLANTELIEWRNLANSGNNTLSVGAADALLYNGAPVSTLALAFNDIFVGNASNVPVAVPMSGDATIVASGALTIANGAINNAKVASGAAIAVNKLAALTINSAVATDGSGFLTPSATTSTELGYVSGVTSAIQTQLNATVRTSTDQTITGIKTFSGQLIGKGTITNDNAAAGFIGEYISTVQGSETNFPTSGQYGDLGSISLAAGDWDVQFMIDCDPNGATVLFYGVGYGTSPGNDSTGQLTGQNFLFTDGTGTNEHSVVVPSVRVSLSGTTTIYCKVIASYSVATPKYRGRISARRVR